MDRIDPKSLSFAEVRKVLSELESAEREARFSTLFRELIVEPLLAAARNKGVDVAEFPSLMGRPAVADAQHVSEAGPETVTSGVPLTDSTGSPLNCPPGGNSEFGVTVGAGGRLNPPQAVSPASARTAPAVAMSAVRTAVLIFSPPHLVATGPSRRGLLPGRLGPVRLPAADWVSYCKR